MTQTSSDTFLSESGFKKNTSLQLVLGIASLYIIFQIVALVLMILSDAPRSMFDSHIIPYTGIWDLNLLLERPYAIFTYTLCNKEFLVLFANCIWLYICGKSIENRYGYMEVIFSYLFISLFSAIIYTLFLQISGIQPTQYNIGAFSTLLGMSVSMIMGKMQFLKINNSLQVPYLFIFFLLMVFSLINFKYDSPQTWILLGTSYLTGILYFLLVNKFFIGKKIYSIIQKTSKKLTPEFREEDILGWDIEELFSSIKKKHPMIAEEKLEELFSKIRSQGFGSLSHIEKSIFYRLMND